MIRERRCVFCFKLNERNVYFRRLFCSFLDTIHINTSHMHINIKYMFLPTKLDDQVTQQWNMSAETSNLSKNDYIVKMDSNNWHLI